MELFLQFVTKWPPAAILDVRKTLLITFLAISDRSAIFDIRKSLSVHVIVIQDLIAHTPSGLSRYEFKM